jgi:methionyl-tRNA formyltransferase
VKCVFFGSPEFALGSLNALLSSRHKVVGVITQPDRPAGRGLKLEPPPVKKRALEVGLPIHQPEKVNSDETFAFLQNLNPEVLAVVAYGEFLGEKLLKYCRYFPVNVHPSLLPDLRGAAPVQWALLRGYQQTGVTTQFMAKTMDAGDILLQEEFLINEQETSQSLLHRLSLEGGRMLVETLDGLEEGSIRARPQDHSKATFAPLLTKEQGLVQFNSSDAKTVYNQIRGLYPWPGAYAFLNKKRVKFLRAAVIQNKAAFGTPGTWRIENDRMLVTFADSVLEILELQPEGKRPMLPREFESGMKASETSRCFNANGE